MNFIGIRFDHARRTPQHTRYWQTDYGVVIYRMADQRKKSFYLRGLFEVVFW